ncbi:MAG: response regulator [Bacteroidetes bacterium]|nr:response regulator [Bacteroidota bacterium]
MKKKVICIDRSNAICFLVKTVLKSNYQVLSEQNSMKAIELLHNNQQIDAIILSIDSETDEFNEIFHHISTSTFFSSTPVIILSESEELQKLAAKNQNVIAVFTKPFDPLELINLMNEQVLNNVETQILSRKRKFFHLN